MKRHNLIDDFFNDQPPLLFIEDLKKPYFTQRPHTFCRKTAKKGEVDIDGIYLVCNFPDEKKLLETVCADFKQFAEVYGIGGNRYPVYLNYRQTQTFEEYCITVTAQKAVITAGDTEGIRRAVIYIEDSIIAAEGAFLKQGSIKRKPWLKSRISRGFFSPTNRPPKNIDELYDDVDYYPDNYLYRLMHDGTNGIWIYTKFSDLLPSPIIEEYGQEYQKRIEKLNRVIGKCARYGIKVYVFSIEPAAFWEEIALKHPGLAGHKLTWYSPEEQKYLSQYCCCPYGEDTQQYLHDSGRLLAQLCPDLGGAICLTTGERLSSCASIPHNSCPRCKDKPRGEILGRAVELLRGGLRDTNPAIELVSWTYAHREWKKEDIADYVKAAPADAGLMQNFEDYGFNRQLGRDRLAIDYWLSYIGPSKMFRHTAREAQNHGKKLWAKMQVCCSHEIASVPYIPSPGHIYQKLKKAKQLGTEGLLECWYFGNYPSIMSKTAGELAFAERFKSRGKFLHNQAQTVYGQSLAPKIAKAWRLFYKGYNSYPTNIMFSYYGPMHDGVVWELALKPKNFSLPRTWQLPDRSDGDRIAECLMYGHTLSEAIRLTERMASNFSKANAALFGIEAKTQQLTDLMNVSRALNLLAKSGNNILKFYQLRAKLGSGTGGKSTLAKMKKIVNAEIENSLLMKDLCLRDSRLGYHSEAEGYKFFPKKLDARVAALRRLLLEEFTEVEQRISAGLPALEYYTGIEIDSKSYNARQGNIESAVWEPLSKGNAAFRMAHDKGAVVLELKSDEPQQFQVLPEFTPFEPSPGLKIYPDGSKVLFAEQIQGLSLFGWRLKRERKKWKVLPLGDGGNHVRISLKKRDFGITCKPFKLAISTFNNPWCIDPAPVSTLNKNHIRPGEYGWIILQK